MRFEVGHGGENLGFWQEVWSIFADPAHIVAELGWTVIQDVILIWLLYGTLWKKVILPKLHEKFDREHKITHHDHKHDD
jgi:hypothetical protein